MLSEKVGNQFVKGADDLSDLNIHIDCLVVIIAGIAAIVDIRIIDRLLMADAAAVLELFALELLVSCNAIVGKLIALFGQAIKPGMIVSVC